MRKVFILVERRADYSRYKPILEKLKADPFFETYLVVTGICLLENHGKDISYIENDGFEINATIPMFDLETEDSGGEMVRSMARVLSGVVTELEKAKPDVVLSGFDIGGNFAVTVAAAHMNIPVAHIQGGEVTGSIDESIRHAMSKFSHIHFPATEDARNRLIKIGENPEDIYVVGCPSIDVLVNTPYVDKAVLEAKYNLDFFKPFVIMIQHPVTTEMKSSLDQIKETIDVIKRMDIQALALLPNNDAGHSKIIEEIKNSGIKWYPSLSTIDFINIYRNAWALVGNSSSGIHETPTFKIPAVNIGNRQMGRERAANVIDVPNNADAIEAGINKALFDEEFRAFVKTLENPYGIGNSSEQIVKILKEVSFEGKIQKVFYEG
jgi:UDP-N-acetylglucosamine 2-epimerase (non-hydrolysing)/GDP/UDP-N,N'-diacetylbacillosamine 2-epimerase (hydrolysing)|tara:strand:+ start:106 stop:1245 length:1140 start_codon:yes stop_codon:yes gene_type:complete